MTFKDLNKSELAAVLTEELPPGVRMLLFERHRTERLLRAGRGALDAVYQR